MRAVSNRGAWLAPACGMVLALGAGACSGGDTSPTQAPEGAEEELPGPSRGSAVVLSADDSVVVAVNRDVGTLSVFAVRYETGVPPVVELTAEVPLGEGSEPWQAVISPNGRTAFVVLRKDQQVVRVRDLKTKPTVDARIAVGSEPTAIAMVPNGRHVWVANSADGTLNEIHAAKMEITGTVDLNESLAETGLLGDVAPRPGLAHPRSLAIRGMKSGGGIHVYATEYYAQRTAPEAPDGANADIDKEGLVYHVRASDRYVSTIPLAPLTDLGFRDHNGAAAGCYPNQLQSITISGDYAYVSSICASPKGPIGAFTGPAAATCAADVDCPGAVAGSCGANKKCATNCSEDAQCGANGGKCNANVCAPNVADIKVTTAPVVSVIDLATDAELPEATASLNARFHEVYEAAGTPDDGSRRYPGIPADVAFIPFTGIAYVAANGADAVFRMKYDFEHASAIEEVGAPGAPFVNLNPAGIAAASAGKNPIGIAIGYTHKPYAFVANDVSRNVTVVDLDAQGIAGGTATPTVVRSAKLPAAGSPEESVLKGKRFFNTGTGRWSLKGQAWNACQSCHVEGLSDNVTWYFARGPRQSVSLEGSFASSDPSDQRIFNWTAIFDEVADFEGNTRGISGGVGAIVSATSSPPAVADRIDLAKAGHAALNGSAEQAADPDNPAGLAAPSVLDDWKNVTDWVKTVRSPRGASNLDPAYVEAGRQLFVQGNCQGCHSGPKWTISTRFYEPSISTLAALATTPWSPPTSFPSALLPAGAKRFMRFPSDNAGLDQIQCILRPVGTFGVADEIAGIAELRADMKTPGQGNEAEGKGYNPPSLLGVGSGAPYLHAGNAVTLESLFGPAFEGHTAALTPYFLGADDPDRAKHVAQLVQFLLSIDESTEWPQIPEVGAFGGDFCATL